jgi:putative transposase
MTKPRRVLPGICYLITRRCSERRFFLRPDSHVTHIFEYLLAALSQRYSIKIHAYVVMSNHYHLVVTDTKGRMPDFQRDLNSLLARAVNAFRGRWESFWDRDSYSAVELIEDGDCLAEMAYTLANPVEAGLVKRVKQWEGATSAGKAYDRPRRIERPRRVDQPGDFFRENLPKFAKLVLTRPECPTIDDESFDERLRQKVRRVEDEAAASGPAMGMKKVMSQDWNHHPKSNEPRCELSPRVACVNKWARIAALQRSADWLDAYAVARAAFVSGDREVEFPVGTWWMCVRLGCKRAAG